MFELGWILGQKTVWKASEIENGFSVVAMNKLNIQCQLKFGNNFSSSTKKMMNDIGMLKFWRGSSLL